jgi:hypothetical protein
VRSERFVWSALAPIVSLVGGAARSLIVTAAISSAVFGPVVIAILPVGAIPDRSAALTRAVASPLIVASTLGASNVVPLMVMRPIGFVVSFIALLIVVLVFFVI